MKIQNILFSILFLPFANAAIAQDLLPGDLDHEGRTYLFDEPLEGVYSNYWSGMRVSGDGSDQTDIHVRSDGKIEFNGTLSLNCSADSGHFWLSSEDEAEGLVPAEVFANARSFFCGAG